MENSIIYRGLILKLGKCKYFQVIEGDLDSLIQNNSSTLVLTYSPGSTSTSLAKSLGLECVGDIEILPTPLPKKYEEVIMSLNGLRFRKLTYDPHTFHLVIVKDSETRVVQDYFQTTIVMSEKDYRDPELINYLFFSGNLQFLKPVGPKNPEFAVRNFPKFVIKNKSVDLISSSEEVFSLRRKYDDYVIRAVDYQDQFISEIRRILDDYGVELVRLNKEKVLSKTSYATYQISQTPTKVSHPKYHDIHSNVMQHRQAVDFTLRTTDMVLYHDFKNKYNNVDILTNSCEFKTPDKYGKRWTAAIKWGSITEDFNHLYQQDDNSNFSQQCQFRCELFFYEVVDERYSFLEEVLINLGNKG